MAACRSSITMGEITECSICLETFKEPKMLPCIHTFCLKCLDAYHDDACPLCRKTFSIPLGGNRHLPTNSFISQLILVKESNIIEPISDQINVCEFCSDDSQLQIPATSYCIECEQHICDRCSRIHKKSKVCGSHQVLCANEVPRSVSQLNSTVSHCDQHPGQLNKWFCQDCRCVLCYNCFVEKHKDNKWTDVIESAKKFCPKLKEDVNNMSASALRKRESIEELEASLSVFKEKMSSTENEILHTYDRLISRLQTHRNQITTELKNFKEKVSKEVANEKSEIEGQFVIMEGFKGYCQEMINKGTAFDIFQSANDLHARAEELLKTQYMSNGSILSRIDFAFIPSNASPEICSNSIGKLTFTDKTSSTNNHKTQEKLSLTRFLEHPSVIHVMPSCYSFAKTSDQSSGTSHRVSPITGITVLGIEVFVVRNSSPQVNAYNTNSFASTRNITFAGSEGLQGIVACPHNNCLYLSDSKQKVLHRYDLRDCASAQWLVGGICCDLSLTKYHTVLASLKEERRIQEYNTYGSMMKDIRLDSMRPKHCVQRSDDNMLILSTNAYLGLLAPSSNICIVDKNGRTVKSYIKHAESRSCSQFDDILNPYDIRKMTADIHDNVLVTNYRYNRLQLLSPTLTDLSDIVIPGHQLNEPHALHFDEINHRLYIGEYAGGRMFVLCVDS